MARSSWMLLLLLLLRLMAAFWLLLGLAHTVAAVAAATKPTYTLGLLAPAAASEIPTSLVTEWKSAFRVAVEVLNSKSTLYTLQPHSEQSDCDWSTAYRGAQMLTMLDNATWSPIIGVVGPACSGAAMAASSTLNPYNLSLVSFAATAQPLSANRALFSNFFRTVYGDQLQAQAIASSIQKLNMTSVTILYTTGYYAMNLAQDINTTVNGAVKIRMEMLQAGDNATIDSVQLGNILNSLQATDFVILVAHPQGAHDIWKAAQVQNKLDYPWWYFGTDGITAFDPADEALADSGLVNMLVGEIGLSPYGGDYSQNYICDEYYAYWQKAQYLGFPAGGQNKSRSYTPYVIDTVRVYFDICDKLLANNKTISRENVLAALRGSAESPMFQGCTGLVAIDPLTGSRSTTHQPPIYDLVSLTPTAWEAKGRIELDKFLTLQPLSRPNSQFGPNSSFNAPNPHPSSKTGAIVGGILAVIALSAALGIAAYVYKRKRGSYNPSNFVRVTD